MPRRRKTKDERVERTSISLPPAIFHLALHRAEALEQGQSFSAYVKKLILRDLDATADRATQRLNESEVAGPFSQGPRKRATR